MTRSSRKIMLHILSVEGRFKAEQRTVLCQVDCGDTGGEHAVARQVCVTEPCLLAYVSVARERTQSHAMVNPALSEILAFGDKCRLGKQRVQHYIPKGGFVKNKTINGYLLVFTSA